MEEHQSNKDIDTESWKETKEAIEKTYSELQDCVKENPTESILLALGAGFILGLLFRR